MRILTTLLLLGPAFLAAQEPMNVAEPGEATHGKWAVVLGARLMDYASYMGSDRNRVALVPVLGAEYDHRLYLGSSRVGVGFGGGIHLLRREGFTWDLGVGFGERRPESRADSLAGMGDRSASVFAGTGLRYRSHGFSAGLTVAHGLRDEAGNRATLSLGHGFSLAPRWTLAAGIHGTWADARSMAYDFGIDAEQAARRSALVAAGDPRLTAAETGPFTPGAGLRDAGGILSVSYRPEPRWTWSLGLFGSFLQGDARLSPLVRRTTYMGVGGGFTCRL